MTPIKVTTTLRVEAPQGAPDAVWRAIADLAAVANAENFPVSGRGEDIFGGALVEIIRRGVTLPTEVPSIAAALANVYVVAGRPL